MKISSKKNNLTCLYKLSIISAVGILFLSLHLSASATINRGNSTLVEQASGTSLVITVPSGIANNDVLVADLTLAGGTSTPPAGWSQIAFVTQSGVITKYGFYHVVTNSSGEPSSYTWTGITNGKATGIMVDYSGVDNNTPLDVTASTFSANSPTNSIDCPSITTVTYDAVLISGGGMDAVTTATLIVPSQMFQIQQSTGTGKRGALADQIFTTAGSTGTRTWTQSPNGTLAMACYLGALRPAAIGPKSGNYQLIDYGFGAGGTTNSYSTNYAVQGTVGEIDVASMSSANFLNWAGLTYTQQPDVPPAPSLTNPSNAYYNKLLITINQGINNLTDVTYAVEISTDPTFASGVKYVQSDGTLGVNPYYQAYGTNSPTCTGWCSTTGVTIAGLTAGATYYARVSASRGKFTQGTYGPAASAATVNPTLTYTLSTSRLAAPPYTVVINNISPGGPVVTSDDQITAAITTNGNNGGSILVSDKNGALTSASVPGNPIGSVTNNLDSLAQGYGLQGVSATQTSGGPLSLVSPYNTTTGNNVGQLLSTSKSVLANANAPVTNGAATFVLKARVANTSIAATDYTDTLTVVANGSF
jgi:hypothetical protein